MYELRWLIRTVRTGHMQLNAQSEVLAQWESDEKQPPVLQYRYALNPLEVELYDPIWSEWQDVESVEEEG